MGGQNKHVSVLLKDLLPTFTVKILSRRGYSFPINFYNLPFYKVNSMAWVRKRTEPTNFLLILYDIYVREIN
jgi:hypothetical protein